MSACNGERQRVLRRIEQINATLFEFHGVDLTAEGDERVKEIESLLAEVNALLSQLPDCSD